MIKFRNFPDDGILLRACVVYVEQGALMSPNPSGKFEDLVAGCVSVVW